LLLFFLRRWSTTFIVALSVPFSLMVTLAFMYFLNISLNILSMMGLLLAVGMLVDNAVVATESIHRHQLEDRNLKKASIKGVKEIALAITAGTLTTTIVFLPNLVSQADETAMYMKFVSIAFVIALVASLVLAQTIVPLLASRVKLPPLNRKKTAIDNIMTKYGTVLEWMLRKRKLSVWIIILILASVAIPGAVVKMDMFPQQDDRRLSLYYNINGSYSLERIEGVVDIAEEYLFKHKEKFEIKSVYTYYQGNYVESSILLEKGDKAHKPQEQIRREIEEGLPKVAIAKFAFKRQRSMGSRDKLRLLLKGKSSARLTKLTKEVAKVLEKVPGLVDVRSEAEVGEQEIQVSVDRERAANYGFSSSYVANMVSVAMRGVNLRKFHDDYGEIDVRVEFQEGDKQTLEDLRNLIIYDNQNNPVKLSSVANLNVRRGPRNIFRESRITSLGVLINLKDITVGKATKLITPIMNRYRLPPGYSWSFGRSFNYESEAFTNMLINLLLALFLIYFIMASLFESLIFPAAIFWSIIFAIIGVWWFFMLTGTSFSMMAFIGVLVLCGVVVNNGIVLIDHINRFRENGHSRYDAIVLAGMERIRPILMTAGTTVLSLVPLCIATTQIGGGGPPYFPMARAIVGGLTFSTIVTLLVLPRIYILLDDLRFWSRRLLKRSNALSLVPWFKKKETQKN
ncbi:MAG: efflux RND transporter permease subunit, partial [bacterium]|nr:efflux RND transporter permease subunit [bacterium]